MTSRRIPRAPARLVPNPRGTAAVEFAFVAPLLIMMLIGTLAYGGYFWRAHALQQIANDAARAALPGLTAVERRDLATAAVAAELPVIAGVDRSLAATTVSEDGGAITVALAYDGTHDVFLNLGPIPMPNKTIRRTAAVRLGGL